MAICPPETIAWNFTLCVSLNFLLGFLFNNIPKSSAFFLVDTLDCFPQGCAGTASNLASPLTHYRDSLGVVQTHTALRLVVLFSWRSLAGQGLRSLLHLLLE